MHVGQTGGKKLGAMTIDLARARDRRQLCPDGLDAAVFHQDGLVRQDMLPIHRQDVHMREQRHRIRRRGGGSAAGIP